MGELDCQTPFLTISQASTQLLPQRRRKQSACLYGDLKLSDEEYNDDPDATLDVLSDRTTLPTEPLISQRIPLLTFRWEATYSRLTVLYMPLVVKQSSIKSVKEKAFCTWDRGIFFTTLW